MTPVTDQWESTEDATMALVVQAEALQITDTPSFEAAVHLRSGIKALMNEVVSFFRPIKQAQDAAKKVTLGEEKKKLEPLEFAVKTINARLEAWDTAQREEKRKAEVAAAREAKETGAIVPAKAIEIPKVDGFGFSTHYTAVVTDKTALIEAVAAGKVSSDVLKVSDEVAKDWAQATGPQTKAKDTPGQVVPMPGVPGIGVVASRRPRG